MGKIPYFKLNSPYRVVISFLIPVFGYFHVHFVQIERGTVLSGDAYLENVGLVGSVFYDFEARVRSVGEYSFSADDVFS